MSDNPSMSVPVRTKVYEILGSISVCFLLVAAIFLAVFAYRAGGVFEWFSQRDLLTISPSAVFTAEAKAGDILFGDFVVRNPGAQTLTILGSKTACSCTVPEGLPLTLGPGETGKIRIRLVVGSFDKAGVFEKSASLLVNRSGSVPTIIMRVNRANGD